MPLLAIAFGFGLNNAVAGDKEERSQASNRDTPTSVTSCAADESFFQWLTMRGGLLLAFRILSNVRARR